MNKDVFSTRRFTIAAGSASLRLPISGGILRYLDGTQPLRFKLVRDALTEELDLRPGMARTYRDSTGFVMVEVFRHQDFPDTAAPLAFEIGWGWGDVQDNRAVANITATATAVLGPSTPCPMVSRFVPRIVCEHLDNDRLRWRETPGAAPIYQPTDADAAFDPVAGRLINEGGGDLAGGVVCLALPNPLVTSRRVWFMPVDAGGSPQLTDPVAVAISGDPLDVGAVLAGSTGSPLYPQNGLKAAHWLVAPPPAGAPVVPFVSWPQVMDPSGIKFAQVLEIAGGGPLFAALSVPDIDPSVSLLFHVEEVFAPAANLPADVAAHPAFSMPVYAPYFYEET